MLKDILFPKLCFSCGYLGGYLCGKCAHRMILITKDTCFYCGRPSYLGFTHKPCERKNGVEAFISNYYYGPVIKKLIKAIKYRLVKEAVSELLSYIELGFFSKLKKLLKIYPHLFIQTIPSTEQRLIERGFNLADEIGNYIGKIIGAPREDYLLRVGHPQLQAKIKEKLTRNKNVRGSFKSKKRIKNSPIFLIDDIVTTGATVHEAVKVLKMAGAGEIIVVSFARG